MKPIAGKLPVLVFLVIVSACQSKAPEVTTAMNSTQKPTQAVASIAKQAQKCWFKTGDKAFKDLRLANEVVSHAGKPRFLLVPRKNPAGLPLLVVQAEEKGDTASGTFTNINTFGPLLQTADGIRILGDVNRWSKGETACT